ncbi:hypothetical protein MBLNU230_g7821t1 [Neophaeotheca triangularis]
MSPTPTSPLPTASASTSTDDQAHAGGDGPSATRKRARETEEHVKYSESVSPTDHSAGLKLESSAGAAPTSTSNFRNVSACNRCRSRKNRCDQRLPACSGCVKARIKCVGFDPVSKRSIPRNYVYYLESRVAMLENLCREGGVNFPAAEEDLGIREDVVDGRGIMPFPPQLSEREESKGGERSGEEGNLKAQSGISGQQNSLDPALQNVDDHEKLDKLVSNIGMVSVQGASDSRYLGSTSGISFARVVFAAVKSSISHPPTERNGTQQQPKVKTNPSDAATGGGTSMRDSFFGLHTKPNIKPAPFPDKGVGLRLVSLYFEHANPQMPILHRPEFMAMFERVYSTDSKKRTSRELYMLNIVFAIGSGIIMDSSANLQQRSSDGSTGADDSSDAGLPNRKKQRLSPSHQHQPEEYHSSAIVHLESFLGSSPAAEGFGGGLEELQAVLLLAGLALLRPVAPGLWYIVGVAVRLGVDLGLHSEDGDSLPKGTAPGSRSNSDAAETSALGRKQWIRDLRRRLWWCVYSFDRLVSACVGRPFGITDQVVTTEFPSLLDDSRITREGFLEDTEGQLIPSYKIVSHHYFRLRLLQSEILQVLQHRQAQQSRSAGTNRENRFMHTGLPSPFLARFSSFRDWRADVDRRLSEWKESAPKQHQIGVAFTPLLLELNYWQAVIMLYRQSLSVPESLAGELRATPGEDLSPNRVGFDEQEDEQAVFLKVAQAGQSVLRTYRQLHRLKLVNYTFLATHHLFMSGISFLYAIWHSTLVRSQLTLDDVDFTILAATSVLTDLIEKCPPAEACRDAFARMSKATISMCMSTTGFGTVSNLGTQPISTARGHGHSQQESDIERPNPYSTGRQNTRRPAPRFDMNLRDLFTQNEAGQQQQLLSRNTVPREWHGAREHRASTSETPGARSEPLTHPISTEPLSHQHQDRRSSTASSSTNPQHYHPPHAPTFPPHRLAHPPAPSPHLPSYHSQPPRNSHFSSTFPDASQTDFNLADLDFLDTFSTAEPSQDFWFGGNGGEILDLGFGTGGTSGAWEEGGTGWEFAGENVGTGASAGATGAFDLYDGFYFGHGGCGAGGSEGGGAL